MKDEDTLGEEQVFRDFWTTEVFDHVSRAVKAPCVASNFGSQKACVKVGTLLHMEVEWK